MKKTPHLAVIAFVATLCAAPPVAAALPASSVVLLPLENFSGVHEAEHELTSLLVRAIAAKGWSVVSGEDIEKQLEEERVRYLDSLDGGIRERIVQRTGAGAIVSSAVFTYSEGRNATVAIEARMVNAGGTAV